MKTTTKKKMALVAITSAVLLTGCQKDLYDPNYVDSKDAPISGIPSDFNWSTISSVNLTVNVDDKYNGEYYYVVEVFDSNPVIDSNAKLLTKGVAKKGQAFSTEFSIPQTLKNIAIRQTDPTGLTVTRVASVASNLTLNFASTTTKSLSTRSSSAISTKSISVAESDFASEAPADAIPYTTDNDQGKATNLILRDKFNQGINLWTANKNLYASGKVHITSLYLASGCVLYILPNAEVTLDNDNSFSQSGNVISINSGGKLILKGKTEIGAGVKLLNKGTIEAADENSYIKISSDGKLYNAGNINLVGQLSGENDNSFIDNYGTINAKNFLLNGNSSMTNTGNVNITNQASITSTNAVWRNESGTFTAKNMEIYGKNLNSFNACKLIVTDYLNMYDCKLVVDAGAYVSCKTLSMNNTRIELGDEAIFNVLNKATYGYNAPTNGIYGTGTKYALLKLKEAAIANGLDAKAENVIYYGGNLQIECSKHPSLIIEENSRPRFNQDNSVVWVSEGKSTLTISSTGCSEGNVPAKGNTPVSPQFPLTVNLGTTYTYAMEDLWPNYGDYDMNDIVVAIKPEYTLSSAEYVQSMTFTTTLKAIGANKPLAAAIQLDNVSDANVSNVTYSVSSTDGSVFAVGSNKVESFNTNEKAKAVIPLFDNAHQFLGSTGITNTVKGGTTKPEKSVSITVTFVANKIKPADISEIATALNFFIVTDKQKTNRTEVHLRGFNATSHANKSLFGTSVDNSKTGLTYKSNSNLVWGMVIPSNFSYPVENTSILTAYPDFEQWAQSGGASNQDWYKTAKTGTTF